MTWEVHIKHFCILKDDCCLWKSTCGFFTLQAELAFFFFNGTSCLLERMTDKPRLFEIEYLIHIVLKRNKMNMSLQLKKKKRTRLVANDKIWPFKWKLDFGEFASVTLSLMASLDFLIEICGDITLMNIRLMNVIFWCCIMCQHLQNL